MERKKRSNNFNHIKTKTNNMKKVLAIVATVATVLMSCTGGTTKTTTVDSTKVDSVKVDADTCKKDSCKKVDTTKKVK